MILEFGKQEYIDIDSITALRWIKEANTGVVVLDGAKMGLNKEQFKIVEKAFLWKHQHAIYDKNMKKGEK